LMFLKSSIGFLAHDYFVNPLELFRDSYLI